MVDVIPGLHTKLASLGTAPVAGISPGDDVSVTWGNLPADVTSAWLGLFVIGDDDRSYLAEKPLNSTSSPPTSFGIPASIAPGSYEIRIYAHKMLDRLAVGPVLEVNLAAAGTYIESVRALTDVAPSGTLEVVWHNANPNPYDVLDIVTADSNGTSQSAAGYTGGGTMGRRNLTIPPGIGQGVYQVALISGSNSAILARSRPFYVPQDANGIRPAGKIVPVWGVGGSAYIRNNGSYQRFNYLEGPANSNNVVKINHPSDAEGATPVLTVTLPNSAGNPDCSVYADQQFTTGNISAGVYEGRLYLQGSSVRAYTTAPFTVTT